VSVVILIGRILFSVLILSSAVGHLTKTNDMAAYAKHKGVPMAWAAVLGGGILLALGGISVLLGIWADLGSLLLALFLIPTAVMMHPFWKESAEGRMMEQIQFNKDLALGGAALMFMGLFAIAGDAVDLTITGPLF
jgi:uncharacterized membrane protein YphA (DoxX/SURF4 family)